MFYCTPAPIESYDSINNLSLVTLAIWSAYTHQTVSSSKLNKQQS